MKKSKKGIKFIFNLSNRLSYTLIAIFVLAIVGVGVYASTYANANGVGHDFTELKPCSNGETLKMVSGVWGCAAGGSSYPDITDVNGKVGIGTTSPTAKLDILGGSLGTVDTNELELARFRGTTNNADLLRFFLDREGAGGDWTTAVHKIQRRVDVTDMGYIEFGDFNDDLITFGEGTTEYMRIDGSGNVGIGTTSPTQKLDVNGNVKATSFTGITLANLPVGSVAGYCNSNYFAQGIYAPAVQSGAYCACQSGWKYLGYNCIKT